MSFVTVYVPMYPRYLMIFDAIINTLKTSFPGSLLLVNKNVIDIYMLITLIYL